MCSDRGPRVDRPATLCSICAAPSRILTSPTWKERWIQSGTWTSSTRSSGGLQWKAGYLHPLPPGKYSKGASKTKPENVEVKITGSGERGVIKEESRKNEGKYWLGVGYHWWKSDFFQGLKKTGEFGLKKGGNIGEYLWEKNVKIKGKRGSMKVK